MTREEIEVFIAEVANRNCTMDQFVQAIAEKWEDDAEEAFERGQDSMRVLPFS